MHNVKFIIEGNEETSNDDLASLVAQNKDKLDIDYILVSDGEICAWKPVIEYSLRGGFNCKLTYTTANNNVHSGLYGGAIPNPALELSRFVNSLYEENKVALDWFYEGVDEITSEQLANNKLASAGIDEQLQSLNVKKLLLEDPEYDFMTQVGLRPTIQVTGFKSGYTGEGYANIVPASAEVRLNFRTVSSQNSKQIIDNFKKYVAEVTPDYVEYNLEFTNDYDPVKINIDSEIVAKTRELLQEAFEDTVLVKPVGGGIPIVSDFKDVLGKETLLVSLGNEDCNMHGVNENFHIELCKKGLKFSELFFSRDLS